ncbi:MAG TPA: hypothetical protein VMU04_08415 [Candidatus Acidoferrum sp.]|nr:hypothetical protein [Candidatus Acidoferrum sp.]
MLNTACPYCRTGRGQTNLQAILSQSILIVAFCLAAAPVHGQPARTDDRRFWMPDGPINAILPVSNTVYIAGDFTYLGPRTGPAALFDSSTGNLLAVPPRISNTLKAVVPDGAGGWFIGGNFTNIGTMVITNVAHLNSDLSLDTHWNARMISTIVNALALDSGTLYVGGTFTRVGGQSISGLVGLNSGSAGVQWNPQISGTVNCIQVTNGLVYIGGQFTSVGSSNRQNLAAISVSNTLANTWDPGADTAVLALRIAGNTVYVGGQFQNINYLAKPRSRLAALDATTGLATTWNPNPNGIVRTIDVGTGVVYVGGDFTTIAVASRLGFAALSSTTGAAQALNLQLQTSASSSIVRAVTLAGTSLYVGGQFTNALGAQHAVIVGVDTGSSLSIPVPLGSAFNGADGTAFGANTIVANNGHVFIGGDFQSVGGMQRQRAAALDLNSGGPLGWAPGFDAPVLCMAYGANSVYLGGSFTNIISPTHTNTVRSLAAVDPVMGTNNSTFSFLGTNGTQPVIVKALAFGGSTLYAGGAFTVVGSQPRRFVAGLDPGTASPGPFNPNLAGGSAGVVSLAIGGGTNLFMAGDFTSISNLSISRLAAATIANSAPVNWNPAPNAVVNVLTATSDSLYVGGNFNSIGGLGLKNFAGFSLLDNSALFVDASLPSTSGGVNAMGATATVIYLGGTFTGMAGNSVQNLGCMASVGTLGYDWNPSTDVAPTTIVLTDEDAFIGGNFRYFGQSPTNQADGYFAVFSRAPQTTISKSGANVQITSTTGDRTDAVLQAAPSLKNPVWASIDTNSNPGFVWTRLVPITPPQQYLRVVAR